VELLKFHCTSCGNCCRGLRVAVTDADVVGLAASTGRVAGELVEWLAPDAVDMTGEPGSFVELSEGRRLMVLAQSQGVCQLLGIDNRCRVYASRPRDCRLFPFDASFTSGKDGKLRRLRLLPLSDCEYDPTDHHDPQELAREDRDRWQELRAYQGRVARWNRLAKHRKRLGHRVGSADAFLAFALMKRSPQADARDDAS